MGKFIQIIEIQTSKIDEIEAIGKRVQDMQGTLPPDRQAKGTIAADRDRPGIYFNIVEFSSYESAMENSNSPEVKEFSAEMAKLCDAPPKFYNLDVVDEWSG
jgi:hypothetical protein